MLQNREKNKNFPKKVFKKIRKECLRFSTIRDIKETELDLRKDRNNETDNIQNIGMTISIIKTINIETMTMM